MHIQIIVEGTVIPVHLLKIHFGSQIFFPDNLVLIKKKLIMIS